MILERESPGSKPGADEAVYTHPRLDAYVDFLTAWDRRDARKGVEATRRLRALGISVCLVSARPDGGGR